MSSPSLQSLFAVVVNWNGGEPNLACLGSLLAAGIAEERIVFVDNASSDDSLQLVRARHPGLLYILNEENLGFGGGANCGARLALEGGAGSVFFVNNDVEMPAETPAHLCAVLASDESIGIVGPRVLFSGEPPIVWAAGGTLVWRQNLSLLLGHGEPDSPRWRETRTVDYVVGCAMLVRRAVFERIGHMDESYFAYMEDVDFCLSAARKGGFQVLTVGAVAAYHAPSSATGGAYNPRQKYMMGVNSVHFLRRWGGAWQWLRFVFFDVLSLPAVWLVEGRRGRGRGVRAKALGIWHGLRGERVTAKRLEPGGTRLW